MNERRKIFLFTWLVTLRLRGPGYLYEIISASAESTHTRTQRSRCDEDSICKVNCTKSFRISQKRSQISLHISFVLFRLRTHTHTESSKKLQPMLRLKCNESERSNLSSEMFSPADFSLTTMHGLSDDTV